MPFHSYQYAGTVCKGKPQPGTANLEQAVVDLWDHTFSFGIYNCRPVRGGVSLSLHGEGRAVDIGYSLVNGKANPLGYLLLAKLKANAWELGIQRIIWDRKRYDKANPNGVAYNGVNPHIDHLHIEQTWEAAKLTPLTLANAYIYVGEPEMTPEQETTLNELVAVRRQLTAVGSNLSAIFAAYRLVKVLRKVDDTFDVEEF